MIDNELCSFVLHDLKKEDKEEESKFDFEIEYTIDPKPDGKQTLINSTILLFVDIVSIVYQWLMVVVVFLAL